MCARGDGQPSQTLLSTRVRGRIFLEERRLGVELRWPLAPRPKSERRANSISPPASGAWESPSQSNLHRNAVDSGVQAAGNAAGARSPPCVPSIRVLILNRMVQYTQTCFDASFAALSDATRRGVLEQLGRADASITDLAEKFHMTLTGMRKHVAVLEQAGLVTTEKVGRVRTCKLGLHRLEEETAWIERYRQLWDARFEELDIVVEELIRKEKVDVRKKRK